MNKHKTWPRAVQISKIFESLLVRYVIFINNNFWHLMLVTLPIFFFFVGKRVLLNQAKSFRSEADCSMEPTQKKGKRSSNQFYWLSAPTRAKEKKVKHHWRTYIFILFPGVLFLQRKNIYMFISASVLPSRFLLTRPIDQSYGERSQLVD